MNKRISGKLALVLCLIMLFSLCVLPAHAAHSITNVKSFYEATGVSGNGNFKIVGVYFDTNDKAHVILGATTNMNIGNANKMDEVYINGVLAANIYKNQGDTSISNTFGSVTPIDDAELVLKSGETTLGTITGYNAYVDIQVENVEITPTFNLRVVATTGSGDNSFNIGGAEVQVILNYSVEKTVSNDDGKSFAESVESAKGDTVIYQIVVKNDADSNIPLNAVIADTLPANLFDLSTVKMGESLETLATVSVNAETNGFVMDDALTLEAGASKTYFVSATVLEDAEPGTYTNTASLSGESLVTEKDTADVVIPEPTTGTLKITKAVEKAYANDTLPANDRFAFSLTDATGAPVSGVAYTIYNADETVFASGTFENGTFSLMNGQYIVIEDILAGTYTITENLPEGSNYDCTWENNTASATVTAEKTTEITCTNIYQRQRGDLTITKSGIDNLDYHAEDANGNKAEYQSTIYVIEGTSDAGESIKMEVVIHGNGSVTIKDLPVGTYTVTEKTDWAWRYDLTSGNGISVTINGEAQTVSFTNTRSQDYWLGGDSFVENVFGAAAAAAQVAE